MKSEPKKENGKIKTTFYIPVELWYRVHALQTPGSGGHSSIYTKAIEEYVEKLEKGKK